MILDEKLRFLSLRIAYVATIWNCLFCRMSRILCFVLCTIFLFSIPVESGCIIILSRFRYPLQFIIITSVTTKRVSFVRKFFFFCSWCLLLPPQYTVEWNFYRNSRFAVISTCVKYYNSQDGWNMCHNNIAFVAKYSQAMTKLILLALTCKGLK